MEDRTSSSACSIPSLQALILAALKVESAMQTKSVSTGAYISSTLEAINMAVVTSSCSSVRFSQSPAI